MILAIVNAKGGMVSLRKEKDGEISSETAY